MGTPSSSISPPGIIDTSIFARMLAAYYLAPDHPAKLRIWRWVYRLAGRPHVRVIYAERARLSLDYSDYVQSHILRYGYYEPEVWEALAKFATANEVLWDVGGHVGGVAIRAALDPRIRAVHAFEPNPSTSKALQRNLRLNPTLRVTHHPAALSDKAEIQHLAPGEKGNTGTAQIIAHATNDTVEVKCISADEVVARNEAPPPTLIKLDVEGYEKKVLCGARGILSSGKVKAIAFEAEVNVEGELVDSELVSMIVTAGYGIHHIRRPDGSTTPRDNFIAAKVFPSRLGP